MPLILRADKGAPLTNAEVDANFVFIDDKADAAQSAAATADGKAVAAQGTADSAQGTASAAQAAAATADAKAVAAQATANAAIPATQKGSANGVCELDSNSLVPSARLPSYVDDVLEFANLAAFPITGESGKIYVALDTNRTYRWSGSAYIEISPSPGSTDSVAEGSVNLYFTVARVLATVLTGLSTAVGGPVVATDTILAAFGKIQNQLNLKANLAGATFTGNVIVPSLNGGQLAGMRNKIINGNFTINQRGVSGTVNLAAGAYGHDRWKAGDSGCTYTFATVDGITTITITAGSLRQVIEDRNLQSGTHVLSWTGTSQGKIGAGSYGPSGVSATVAGGENLTVEFNAGTLALVQFEPGATSTAFEHRLVGAELALSQRYYETGYARLDFYASVGSESLRVAVPFMVQKRTVPTITKLTDTLLSNVSVLSATSGTPTQTSMLAQVSGNAIGNVQGAFTWTASAEL